MRCPKAYLHTPAPSDYAGWRIWSAQMALTHDQYQCPGCGLRIVWVRRK